MKYISKDEFRKFEHEISTKQSEQDSKLELLSIEVNNLKEQFTTEQSLHQELLMAISEIQINNFSYNNMRERDAKIYALKNFLNWSTKRIAELFSLTDSRVNQILGSFC